MKRGRTRKASGRASRNARLDDKSLRKHVAHLLKGGGAHVHFEDALNGFPLRKRGVLVHRLPHTGWQLLEHVRIAQLDILQFSRNPKHVSPDFPAGYWPKTPVPPNEASWERSVRAFRKDLKTLVRLVENPRTNLFAKIPHGHGETILREALLAADHNAYHLGQLVYLRRALGAWPEA